jgi:hypothetical protein
MSPKPRFIPVGILLASLALSATAAHSVAPNTSVRIPAPSPAPTPAPSPPQTTWEFTAPLAEPLLTEEQALDRARQIDARVWDHPWSIDRPNAEQGRITVEPFNSRTEESAQAGRGEGFPPEVDADAGHVWRIAIKGRVKLSLLGLGANPAGTWYDGVTYVISQRTGGLLEVISGTPE